jgi:copper chaperone CopZ
MEHGCQKRREKMKKTYKVDVDCAACAEKMQEAIKNTEGIKDAALSFMTLKVKVEFEDGVDPDAVMQEARKNCKKVEDDMEIYL